MSERKIPVRKCIGCQEGKHKSELIRIVKSKEGEISLDLTGKKSGRGAYICKNAECFKKVQKGNKLNRAFSCNVSQEVYNQLAKEFELNAE